jgi:cobalt-zinc-cadmium efflux system outer membrane protein
MFGCASVDPSADYRRTTENVAQITGQTSVYQPGDDASIVARVESLLADGITADEAVQVALLNNPRLQAAWMNVGMARADFVQAGLLSNPSLGGSLRFPSGGGLANLELAIAQNLADLWQIPARQRAAGSAVEETILQLAKQAADLASDTRIAYYRAVGADQLHTVAQENLTIAEQLLDLAINRQGAGAGTELEVNLSRSAVLEAQLTVESSRLEDAEDRRSLARLLGIETDAQTLSLTDACPQSFEGHFETGRVIEHALSKRLDIRAAEQAVAQAESRLAEERLKVFPFLELGVDLERGERGAAERGENTDFIIGPGWNLELPIFDQNQAQIAKALYGCEQARKELESIRRSAVQDVRGTLDKLATAWKVAEVYRDRFIPLARNNLELSRDSYSAGRASFLAVLEAQRSYLDTRKRSIEALRGAVAVIPELERVTASPVSELMRVFAEYPATRLSASRPAPGEGDRTEKKP